jgi:hypothetical protein
MLPAVVPRSIETMLLIKIINVSKHKAPARASCSCKSGASKLEYDHSFVEKSCNAKTGIVSLPVTGKDNRRRNGGVTEQPVSLPYA